MQGGRRADWSLTWYIQQHSELCRSHLIGSSISTGRAWFALRLLVFPFALVVRWSSLVLYRPSSLLTVKHWAWTKLMAASTKKPGSCWGTSARKCKRRSVRFAKQQMKLPKSSRKPSWQTPHTSGIKPTNRAPASQRQGWRTPPGTGLLTRCTSGSSPDLQRAYFFIWPGVHF